MLTLVPKPNDTPKHRLQRAMEALFQDMQERPYLAAQLVTATVVMQGGIATLHEEYSKYLLGLYFEAYDRSEFSDEPDDAGRLCWIMDTAAILASFHRTDDVDIPEENKSIVLFEFWEFAPAFTMERIGLVSNTVQEVRENTEDIVTPE